MEEKNVINEALKSIMSYVSDKENETIIKLILENLFLMAQRYQTEKITDMITKETK